MTREEAKQDLWSRGTINTLSKVECNDILNKVFDSLEQRNAELEQKVKELEEENLICATSMKELYNNYMDIKLAGILEEPKTCEGCKHRNHLADETEPCNSCFVKIGYGNYYESK